MPTRLLALDEGPDIPLDRAMIVVGRHPQCDARIDSLRVSRHHCCMTRDKGEVIVRDLGSTNGIRINGQRVEIGRLRPGDELSIAHIRYRYEDGEACDATMADQGRHEDDPSAPAMSVARPEEPSNAENKIIAAAVQRALPAGLAERCEIQVILKVPGLVNGAESHEECRPNSSP